MLGIRGTLEHLDESVLPSLFLSPLIMVLFSSLKASLPLADQRDLFPRASHGIHVPTTEPPIIELAMYSILALESSPENNGLGVRSSEQTGLAYHSQASSVYMEKDIGHELSSGHQQVPLRLPQRSLLSHFLTFIHAVHTAARAVSRK